MGVLSAINCMTLTVGPVFLLSQAWKVPGVIIFFGGITAVIAEIVKIFLSGFVPFEIFHGVVDIFLAHAFHMVVRGKPGTPLDFKTEDKTRGLGLGLALGGGLIHVLSPLMGFLSKPGFNWTALTLAILFNIMLLRGNAIASVSGYASRRQWFNASFFYVAAAVAGVHVGASLLQPLAASIEILPAAFTQHNVLGVAVESAALTVLGQAFFSASH